MEQNIVHVLQQRETDSSACNYKNFPAKNYFNAAMMMKMEIRRTLSLGGHNFDDAVKHLSWNCVGEVLACGQPNRGVKLVRPNWQKLLRLKLNWQDC